MLVKDTNHHMASVDHIKMNSWCKFGECSTHRFRSCWNILSKLDLALVNFHNRKCLVSYQNIRSLVHICRKLAASLQHTVVASLPQTCFSYANYFSGTLFWHTMCAASLQCTVVVHYYCVPEVCGTQLPCTALFPPPPPHTHTLPHPPTPSLSPTPPYFFSSLPPGGVWEKKWGDRSVTKNKNLGVGMGKKCRGGGMVGVIWKIKIWGWGWQFLTQEDGDGVIS